MTYDAREKSIEGGSPVELYQFLRGSFFWYFTSAETDIARSGITYLSRSLKRSSVEATQEQARSALTIDAPVDFEIASLFRITAPTDVIGVIVTRYHTGDSSTAVLWQGRVLNCEWKEDTATLNCEPASTSLKRTGLRRLYGPQCPHVLFSPLPACGLDRNLHKIDTTVTAVSGAVLSVAALDTLPYAGGWIERDMGDGQIERRFIREFSGLDLTLTLPFQVIAVGDAVTVFPGCDHTISTCHNVYGNLDNYGGWPFTPSKNPFDGTPVY